MLGRVMFANIVRSVEFPFSPDDFELVLFSAVPDPVVAHVDGFGNGGCPSLCCRR
jgi:hypothetical protein